MPQPGHELAGRLFFLAAEAEASEKSLNSNIDAEQVQEGVVSFARAVFARGGTLSLAGSAPLLPLVLTVAAEFWDSDVEHEEPPSHSPLALVRLLAPSASVEDLAWWEDLGILSIAREPDTLDEAFGTLAGGDPPSAMLCLGGTGEVLSQSKVFRARYSSSPIWWIAATGGDCSQGEVLGENQAVDEILKELRNLRLEFPSTEEREPDLAGVGSTDFIPYPLLMQLLIELPQEDGPTLSKKDPNRPEPPEPEIISPFVQWQAHRSAGA